MEQPKVVYSLDDLDQGKACERPHEFEVQDEHGKGTGFYLAVIGGQAPAIIQFVEDRAQKQRVDDALALKSDPRGKRLHVTPVKDDIQWNNELLAMRIVGWRGETLKDAFSPENATRLVKNNPWGVRDQIVLKSEDMKLFPMTVATS